VAADVLEHSDDPEVRNQFGNVLAAERVLQTFSLTHPKSRARCFGITGREQDWRVPSVDCGAWTGEDYASSEALGTGHDCPEYIPVPDLIRAVNFRGIFSKVWELRPLLNSTGAATAERSLIKRAVDAGRCVTVVVDEGVTPSIVSKRRNTTEHPASSITDVRVLVISAVARFQRPLDISTTV
jgi:hypothetical protein